MNYVISRGVDLGHGFLQVARLEHSMSELGIPHS